MINQRHNVRLTSAVVVLLIALYASSCIFPNKEFSVSRWKSGDSDERQQMAEDFLAKNETKGMSLSQLRELLGEPDYGPYAWMYDLSVNGAPPSGHQPTQVYFERPQLYVYFEGLFVRDVRIILVAEVKDDLKFDPDFWKASRPAKRLRMVASLLTSKLLKRRSKDEVRQILGNPDRERETDEIQYSLGERFIDLVTLSFTRDSDGRISDAQIIEH